MTPEKRLAAFKAILEKSPQDAFARYSVAMAHRSLDQLAEAVQIFSELERIAPAYVPCYLMHGQVLEQLGRLDSAKETYQRGSVAAAQANDHHARGELMQALEALS